MGLPSHRAFHSKQAALNWLAVQGLNARGEGRGGGGMGKWGGGVLRTREGIIVYEEGVTLLFGCTSTALCSLSFTLAFSTRLLAVLSRYHDGGDREKIQACFTDCSEYHEALVRKRGLVTSVAVVSMFIPGDGKPYPEEGRLPARKSRSWRRRVLGYSTQPHAPPPRRRGRARRGSSFHSISCIRCVLQSHSCIRSLS